MYLKMLSCDLGQVLYGPATAISIGKPGWRLPKIADERHILRSDCYQVHPDDKGSDRFRAYGRLIRLHRQDEPRYSVIFTDSDFEILSEKNGLLAAYGAALA